MHPRLISVISGATLCDANGNKICEVDGVVPTINFTVDALYEYEREKVLELLQPPGTIELKGTFDFSGSLKLAKLYHMKIHAKTKRLKKKHSKRLTELIYKYLL